LEYGVENGSPQRREESDLAVKDLVSGLKVIPLAKVTPIFAKIKANLRRKGRMSEDFDVLIGATAKAHNLTLVTNNTKHFKNIEGLALENWAQEEA